MMMKRLLATALLTASALPAAAHPPLGGMPMETLAHGLMSGVGHPVLGFDHLFFVALVGVAALFTGRALLAPAFYILGMLAGTMLAMAGLGLPLAEMFIVASLIGLGFVVSSGRALTLASAGLVFAGFGLFHGTAFAGAILGQEGGANMAVIAGYLAGLGAVQYLISIAAGLALSRLWDAGAANAMAPRLAGALTAGAGLFLALEMVEGAAFAALGLG